MKEKAVSCCFTGHRRILPEHIREIRGVISEVLRGLYETGFRTFISGGAVGFDLIAAEVVIELREDFPDMKLVMALPCKNQHERWSRADKFKYEKILDAADETVFLCETYCTGCMHLRNKYLVDNSDICVAYYNYRSGGTAYTVNYARDKGIDVINVIHRM